MKFEIQSNFSPEGLGSVNGSNTYTLKITTDNNCQFISLNEEEISDLKEKLDGIIIPQTPNLIKKIEESDATRFQEIFQLANKQADEIYEKHLKVFFNKDFCEEGKEKI